MCRIDSGASGSTSSAPGDADPVGDRRRPWSPTPTPPPSRPPVAVANSLSGQVIMAMARRARRSGDGVTGTDFSSMPLRRGDHDNDRSQGPRRPRPPPPRPSPRPRPRPPSDGLERRVTARTPSSRPLAPWDPRSCTASGGEGPYGPFSVGVRSAGGVEHDDRDGASVFCSYRRSRGSQLLLRQMRSRSSPSSPFAVRCGLGADFDARVRIGHEVVDQSGLVGPGLGGERLRSRHHGLVHHGRHPHGARLGPVWSRAGWCALELARAFHRSSGTLDDRSGSSRSCRTSASSWFSLSRSSRTEVPARRPGRLSLSAPLQRHQVELPRAAPVVLARRHRCAMGGAPTPRRLPPRSSSRG